MSPPFWRFLCAKLKKEEIVAAIDELFWEYGKGDRNEKDTD